MSKAFVLVDSEKCKGCELCVAACPVGSLKLSPYLNRNVFHPAIFAYCGKRAVCTACGICYWVSSDLPN